MKEIPVHVFLGVPELSWSIWSRLYDALFWLDVIANFFFTYKDDNDNEVDSLLHIWHRYVMSYFLIDVLACCPEELTEVAIGLLINEPDLGTEVESSSSSNAAKGAKLTRLNRISRLLRLLRLGRLTKLAEVKKTKAWMWMQSLRGVRILNFFVCLFFSAHLLACGWYLCGALHVDPQKTWLSRRTVNADSENLLQAS
eukprot:CAMPEP_0170629744 /NCGR_PEP_ID=MMETSP0224-20130122/33537_1 /TAXON_ID=285029 /ORGANISM="Togula jolla, Strain CCCM 725" /LENGTH=197 /DNA_ID=CAMNT_0010957569 /DNA_START=142 /DNA_END=731 /DNA_ORIENTATION=+